MCTKLISAVVMLLALQTPACSSVQNSGKGTNAGKGRPQGANSEGGLPTSSPRGGASNGSGGSGDQPEATAVVQPAGLGLWCKAVAGSASARRPEHSTQFGYLCTPGGQPTEVFGKLIAGSFTGTGEPAITGLNAPQPIPDNGQVSWSYGSGIKLQIPADKHFKVVAPRQGDAEIHKGLLIADGATDVVVTSNALQSNGEKGWVRGWDMTQDWVRVFAGIFQIRTAYSYRVDHYDFGQGNYLYASTMTKSVALIKNYQLLNALLTVDGVAYLVVIGDTAVADQGSPDLVASNLMDTVRKAIKQVYKQSAQVN